MADRSKNYTSIYTDEATRDALEFLMEKTGDSRSEVVRQAVIKLASENGKSNAVVKKVRELVVLTGA